MCECVHVDTDAFYRSIQSAEVFTAVHLTRRDACLCERVWRRFGKCQLCILRHGILISVLFLFIHRRTQVYNACVCVVCIYTSLYASLESLLTQRKKMNRCKNEILSNVYQFLLWQSFVFISVQFFTV